VTFDQPANVRDEPRRSQEASVASSIAVLAGTVEARYQLNGGDSLSSMERRLLNRLLQSKLRAAFARASWPRKNWTLARYAATHANLYSLCDRMTGEARGARQKDTGSNQARALHPGSAGISRAEPLTG
jgi:hypothetical protein